MQCQCRHLVAVEAPLRCLFIEDDKPLQVIHFDFLLAHPMIPHCTRHYEMRAVAKWL